MTTYYRNRTTGIVQAHPKAGIGDALNSDEIEETGKPRTSLAPSKKEIKDRKALLKDQTTGATGPGQQEEGGI